MSALSEDIIDAMRAQKRPLGAYAIADLVSKKRRKRCHPNSIYRCLHRLTQTREVARIASLNAYAPLPPNARPVMWLVCLQCKMVAALDAGPIMQMLDTVTLKYGFKPQRHILEATGFCRGCSNRSRLASN
jgi:Fur family transcriptional regulator, zinc uptake regulator